MKKACLIFVLSLISSYIFAQGVEVGLQIAPTISFSRVDDQITTGNYKTEGSKLKLSVGPVVDINLTDNIAFSTGLFFSSKAVQYSATIDATDDFVETNANYDVDLQYLQLPIGLKLFTGEIGTGLRIYVEIGTILDAKIAEKYDTDTQYTGAFGSFNNEELDSQEFAKLFDAEVHFGIGTEIEVGDNKAYVGIIYNRGLIDVLHRDFHKFTTDYDPNDSQDVQDEKRKKLSINTDLIGLVVGFKF